VQFVSPEARLAKAVQRAEAERNPAEKRPAWQQALASARLPLYDVHWTPAIVVEKPGGKKNEAWRVGLADGRILPLSVDNAAAQRKLAPHDVVLVRDNNGRYVYSSDPRRSSTQSVPQRENYQQPDWRMPQRSQPAYYSEYWR
jgi:hypothetical protein